MGYTGASLEMSYLGASKLDPLMTRVRGNPPEIHRRHLARLLRLHILPRLAPQYWAPWQKLVFCKFEKTVTAVRRGLFEKDCQNVLAASRHRAKSFLGKQVVNQKIEASEGSGENPYYLALIIRLYVGHRFQQLIRPNCIEGLVLQLWIDTHLDLASYVCREGVRGIRFKATHELRPHSRRFVWSGELPDLTPLIPMANLWHDVLPTYKNNTVCMLVHLFLCKTQHHKCQIRNTIRILWKYSKHCPSILDLVKDLIHVSLLGNYPHANYRPDFLTRMQLRESALLIMEETDLARTFTWMVENRRLVYYCLKEFWVYTVRFCSATESILRETQYHDRHKLCVISAMDTARSMLNKGYQMKLDLKKVMQDIETELKRVHDDLLKFLTKLRKGSFEKMVLAKLKTWVGYHIKRKMQTASQCMKDFVVERGLSNLQLQSITCPSAAPQNFSILTALPEELSARIAGNLDWVSLHMLHQTCRAMRVLSRRPWVLRQSMASSLRIWNLSASELQPVREMAVLDLGDATLRNVTLAAQYASSRSDGLFDLRWLPKLGMSERSVAQVETLYKLYDLKDIPDNGISRHFLPIYRNSPRDLSIFYSFVSEIGRFRCIEIRPLTEQVMRCQIEACRLRMGLEPWQPTPKDIGVRRYCGGCMRWADVAVVPSDGGAAATNVYALGLASASLDAIDDVLHCKRDITPGCALPLQEIDMLGFIVRMRGPKRPGRWYGLCGGCGILTEFSYDRMTEKGPDCGMHKLPIRQPTYRVVTPLSKARVEAGFSSGSDVLARCWYCNCPVTPNRCGSRVRVLNLEFQVAEVVLCRKDIRAAGRVFRSFGMPSLHHIREAIEENRNKYLLKNLHPATKMKNVWHPQPKS